ncbi:hypothetical protein ILUMI_02396 [Ignelater luminosus]|uniref:PPIase cyclophilin-type domain-containing protein n=1 Tax=Ignelater luminosus TaxID=2038154 RepID=A0A8K0DNV3_IGNLU|nr:hypothetical protein ILUMI_02396 [Ignelater luminosus]
MAYSRKNTNGLQFFITYHSWKQLDNKLTVFRRVVGGVDTLTEMELKWLIKIKDKAQIFVDPYQEANEQHINTAKHKERAKKMRKTNVSRTSLRQSFATSSRSSGQEDFNLWISANIPLNKMQNPKFKLFLETFCDKIISHESMLRKNYVNLLYDNIIMELNSQVKDEYLFFIVDETTVADALLIY